MTEYDPLAELDDIRRMTSNNRHALTQAIIALQEQDNLDERSKMLSSVLDRFHRALTSLENMEKNLEKRGILLRSGAAAGLDREAARTEILGRLDRIRDRR